jgi:hypothetical protein
MPPLPPIPTTWTPTQAWLVYEWLTDLAEAVWDQYDAVLVERCMLECIRPPEDRWELAEDHDEIPF